MSSPPRCCLERWEGSPERIKSPPSEEVGAGLLANIAYEVYGGGEIDPGALYTLKSLPERRRLAPGAENAELAPAACGSLNRTT